MRKTIPRLLTIPVLLILLLLLAMPAMAQGQTISGTGAISGGPLPFGPGLTLTFPPLGGPVTGVISGSAPFMNGGETCTQTFTGTADGTFAGKDGGAASGSLQITYQVVCGGGTNTQNYSGTWTGALYANGSGSGTWTSAYGGGTWQVTYPAAQFQAIAAPPELDYIYFERTYGLNLEDGDKPWPQDELRLLDEALRELPPDIINRLPPVSIRRFSSDWDENWNLVGSYGKYFWNSIPDRPSQLHMYDAAWRGGTSDDEAARSKFKATFVHELTHSLQETAPTGGLDTVNKNPYNNSLLVQYKNATGPDVDPNNPDYYYGWHWNLTGNKKWTYQESPDTAARNNAPPYRTGDPLNRRAYARTNPLEDMSVSVSMYMYDPQYLKAQSPKRYEFIRQNIFGGVEYENGVRIP